MIGSFRVAFLVAKQTKSFRHTWNVPLTEDSQFWLLRVLRAQPSHARGFTNVINEKTKVCHFSQSFTVSMYPSNLFQLHLHYHIGPNNLHMPYSYTDHMQGNTRGHTCGRCIFCWHNLRSSYIWPSEVKIQEQLVSRSLQGLFGHREASIPNLQLACLSLYLASVSPAGTPLGGGNAPLPTSVTNFEAVAVSAWW